MYFTERMFVKARRDGFSGYLRPRGTRCGSSPQAAVLRFDGKRSRQSFATSQEPTAVGRELRRARQAPRISAISPPARQRAEHGEAERELVDPQPEEVDPRAEPMALQPQHEGQGSAEMVSFPLRLGSGARGPSTGSRRS